MGSSKLNLVCCVEPSAREICASSIVNADQARCPSRRFFPFMNSPALRGFEFCSADAKLELIWVVLKVVLWNRVRLLNCLIAIFNWKDSCSTINRNYALNCCQNGSILYIHNTYIPPSAVAGIIRSRIACAFKFSTHRLLIQISVNTFYYIATEAELTANAWGRMRMHNVYLQCCASLTIACCANIEWPKRIGCEKWKKRKKTL